MYEREEKIGITQIFFFLLRLNRTRERERKKYRFGLCCWEFEFFRDGYSYHGTLLFWKLVAEQK